MNLLLLVVGDASPETIRRVLERGPWQVHVVAPTVVGALDWLATADDDAHMRAELRAHDAEQALDGLVPVTSAAGDVDPVTATADALGVFPATEIVVTGAAADSELERALAVFGLPVRRIGPPPGRRAQVNKRIRALAGGRDAGSVFALVVGMNVALMVAAIALSLIVLLVLWASGVY